MLNLQQFDEYKQIPKVWGREIWLCNTPLYCSKLLVIEPGFQCSLHYHPIKNEDFFMIDGTYVQVDLGGLRVLMPGDSVHIPAQQPHRFGVPEGQSRAVLLEVSTRHEDSDVVRLEESGPIQGIAP